MLRKPAKDHVIVSSGNNSVMRDCENSRHFETVQLSYQSRNGSSRCCFGKADLFNFSTVAG